MRILLPSVAVIAVAALAVPGSGAGQTLHGLPGHHIFGSHFGHTFSRSGLDRRFPIEGDCSVFRRRPCTPTVCSVFQREPCVPGIPYPYGETLQLTITSPSSDKTPGATAGEAAPADSAAASGETKPSADAPKLDSIRAMFDVLRSCWVPPPKDQARPGMQMTVRLSFKRDGEVFGAPRVTYVSHDAPEQTRTVYHDAITAALDRCVPLRFSAGLGGAIAGRPIAVRFVDNRKDN